MNVNLDQRQAELIEQTARGLAEELRPTLTLVNGFVRRPPEVKFIITDKGPMAYIGVKMPRELIEGAKNGPSIAVLDHFLLMGLIPPGAKMEDWFMFPILLRRIATMLGAPTTPDGVMEMRTGSKKAEIVDAAKGFVSEANVHAGSGRITSLVEPGTGGVTTEHQTITLRWKAPSS